MEIFQSEEHFRRVELRLPRRKLFALNVQHEISSTNILHNKINTSLSLETRMQSQQERMPFASGCQKDAFFGASTIRMLDCAKKERVGYLPFNFIVIDYEFLFQHFDCVQPVCLLFLR